jgi:hypothetical protein
MIIETNKLLLTHMFFEIKLIWLTCQSSLPVSIPPRQSSLPVSIPPRQSSLPVSIPPVNMPYF